MASLQSGVFDEDTFTRPRKYHADSHGQDTTNKSSSKLRQSGNTPLKAPRSQTSNALPNPPQNEETRAATRTKNPSLSMADGEFVDDDKDRRPNRRNKIVRLFRTTTRDNPVPLTRLNEDRDSLANTTGEVTPDLDGRARNPARGGSNRIAAFLTTMDSARPRSQRLSGRMERKFSRSFSAGGSQANATSKSARLRPIQPVDTQNQNDNAQRIPGQHHENLAKPSSFGELADAAVTAESEATAAAASVAYTTSPSTKSGSSTGCIGLTKPVDLHSKGSGSAIFKQLSPDLMGLSPRTSGSALGEWLEGSQKKSPGTTPARRLACEEPEEEFTVEAAFKLEEQRDVPDQPSAFSTSPVYSQENNTRDFTFVTVTDSPKVMLKDPTQGAFKNSPVAAVRTFFRDSPTSPGFYLKESASTPKSSLRGPASPRSLVKSSIKGLTREAVSPPGSFLIDSPSSQRNHPADASSSPRSFGRSPRKGYPGYDPPFFSADLRNSAEDRERKCVSPLAAAVTAGDFDAIVGDSPTKLSGADSSVDFDADREDSPSASPRGRGAAGPRSFNFRTLLREKSAESKFIKKASLNESQATSRRRAGSLRGSGDSQFNDETRHPSPDSPRSTAPRVGPNTISECEEVQEDNNLVRRWTNKTWTKKKGRFPRMKLQT